MDWAVIIQLVIDMISKCMENRSKASIAIGLANPGLREAFALRRVLRSQGLRGKELRLEVDFAFGALKDMEPDEINAILTEAAGDE